MKRAGFVVVVLAAFAFPAPALAQATTAPPGEALMRMQRLNDSATAGSLQRSMALGDSLVDGGAASPTLFILRGNAALQMVTLLVRDSSALSTCDGIANAERFLVRAEIDLPKAYETREPSIVRMFETLQSHATTLERERKRCLPLGFAAQRPGGRSRPLAGPGRWGVG